MASKKGKKPLFIIGGIVVVGLAVWALFFRGEAQPEVEYRYAAAEKGDLSRSISANGQLVALTSVDVKSKAGGEVVKLAVEEGDYVKAGDLIARIDPRDTQASYDQANADLSSAEARVTSAEEQAKLERDNQRTGVRDAELAVQTAEVRLGRAREQYSAQPARTKADIESAQASLKSAQEAFRELQTVTIPQKLRDTDLAVAQTKAQFDTAQANLDRQRALLERGYVAQSVVDQAQSQFESARSSYESAKKQKELIQPQLDSQLEAQRARVSDAQASLKRASAGNSDIVVAKRNVEEAEKALSSARVNLEKARDAATNIKLRDADIAVARSNTVRSRVSVANAKVQLESTTVNAPREGYITQKYLEEGTIIPPGTSTFSQGTSLVQISDTSKMYVECQVDEADIASVKLNQNVKVILEAYPRGDLRGTVTRVNPGAATTNNITAIKVRVEIQPQKGIRLMPGMTATCEFLTLEKKGVLIVPTQAIKREQDKTYVLVKGAPGKAPVRRDVKVGEVGNAGTEILEGLKVGEEVVTAEINMAEIREIQQRMESAQQGGGGLAGGGPRGPTSRSTNRAAGGGGGGGGGR
ncbi:MAG: efflux RND transporter periplasmic adaptor subunit [Armatimonadetes bacterium]|nr:efflux RND transporter periplasmic adaptor subunit [Armatimonadota bacterium]